MLSYSSSNTIANNTASNNGWYGIYLDSSSNNTLTNNTASNNEDGVRLSSSASNTIANNTASNNWWSGIYLYFSSSNTISDNTMVSDGIFIEGKIVEHWNTHYIDTSNTVNGKPVYYWKNQTGGTVPAGAGEVILANCTGVTVEGQNVSGGSVGILMGFSSNNTIANNTASYNEDGIYLRSSSNNTVANNTASYNVDGVLLSYSSNNTIVNNTASNNGYGIRLYSSGSNATANNTTSNNASSRNTIYHNNFINNTNQAYDNIGNNYWNASYPTGGNYWSDYNGIDIYSGPGQNVTGSDGMGDAPYTNIEGGAGAQDNYPLMYPMGEKTYGPIRINNNTDFANHATSEGWGGNGTEADPYIIENYNINGTGYGYCIYIGNTTDYFVVRNCSLHDASGNSGTYYWDSALVMYNVTNGAAVNNTASNNGHGISLYKSGNNNITNNRMYNNSLGLWVFSYTLEDFNNSIDTTNTVNAKPVYYFFKHDNLTLENVDAGHITVAGSKNVTIRNIRMGTGDGIWMRFMKDSLIEKVNVSGTYLGVLTHISDNITIKDSNISNTKANDVASIQLQNTTNSVIENVTVRNSADHGVLVGWSSDYNLIKNSIFYNNTYNGIFLYYSTSNDIVNNTVSSNNWTGIPLYYSDSNTLTNNTVSFNGYQGIGLWDSNSNIIENNTCTENNNNGIYLYNSTFNRIDSNNCSGNLNYHGISIDYISDNNTITNNLASSNYYQGIGLWNSNGNLIENDTCIKNGNDGIYLYNSTHNRINSNNCSSNINYHGISIDSSSNNTITNNTAWNNGYYGIYLGSSYDNTIYHNKFINNTHQAYDDTGNNSWNAPYPTGGNYWSDYNGTDNYSGPGQNVTGSDGIGDTPYTNIEGGAGAQDNYPLMSPAGNTSDTTPPSSSVSQISPYWRNTNVTLGLNATDDTTLSNITLYYRFSTDNSTWSAWTQYGSPISASGTSWTGTTTFTFPDGDGYYEFYTIAKDAAGNTETKSTADSICGYDSTLPSVSIGSPSEGSMFNISAVAITWTGNDSLSGIDHYEVRIDNGSWINVGTNTSYDFTGIADGSHTVDVKAVDNASNEATDSVTFTTDTTNPTVSIVLPSDGAIFNRSSVTVSWNGSDVTCGIDHYEVRIDNGSWINVGTNTSYDFTGLSDGSHTVDVKAIDNATNEAADSISFIVDVTTPTVSITSPADGALFNTSSVGVIWTGSDDTSGIEHYEVSIDSGSWINVGTNTSYSFTSLQDGSHSAEVKAIDNAGNENSTSVTFTVDTTPPEINIDSPSEGSLHTADVQVTWHGTDATSGINHYEIRMDSGAWIDAGTNTTYHFGNLTDGEHTVYVKAIDNAGNEAEANVTFTVDATAPTVTSHSPTGNDVSVDTVITVTFSEAMDHNTVSILINGVSGTISWNGTTATFTPSSNLNYATEYTVHVTGSDTAGNAMEEYTWSFSTTDMGTITGTVTDENGNPVEGATVSVDSGGEPVTTDANGHFEIQAHAGNRTLTISKDGYEDKTVSAEVTPGETTSVPPVELPEAKNPSGEFPWLYLILLLIIVMAVIALLIAKRKKPQETQPESEEVTEESNGDDEENFEEEMS